MPESLAFSSDCDRRSFSFWVAEDVAEAADLRADATELFFDMLVAAVEQVEARPSEELLAVA